MLKNKKKFLFVTLFACASLSSQNNLAQNNLAQNNLVQNNFAQEKVGGKAELKNKTVRLNKKLKEYKEHIKSLTRAFCSKKEKNYTDAKIEKEVDDYLSYVAQNPKLIIKFRQKVFFVECYKELYPGRKERVEQLRAAFQQCLSKNAESDCRKAFCFISASFFSEIEQSFL